MSARSALRSTLLVAAYAAGALLALWLFLVGVSGLFYLLAGGVPG